MVLRSLSMYGFKSFADKTTIQFGTGTTAIIGPNGCGKSNVIDAIRWVFGEQKASALRSSNMQDVIFSGTQKRSQLGMAEVTLTIDNANGILPVEYGQVAITRSIFRTGESEYRVNKVPCRLRDIQDLFMDTGIGSSAYTTIENNMINQILSDKAEERRILFDEAAGIGKYKHRRKDSQKQLERTSQDLLRINDKVQEADRQVRMLARHVEKARRYKSYFDDLKALEVGFENGRYSKYAQALAAKRRELEEQETQQELLKARLSALESGIEKRELNAMEKENELQIASRNVGDAGTKVNELDREISVSQERRRALEERTRRFEQELEGLDRAMEEKNRLRMQIEKSMIERQSKHGECTERVNGAQDELAAFDSRLDQSRDAAEELTREQIECINAIGENRNAVSNIKANLNNCLERAQRFSREIASLEARVEEYRDINQRCHSQLAEASESQVRLNQSRETLLGRIEREDKRYQQIVEAEKRCEAQSDASKSQLKFLDGLNAAFEGYEGGVKALLTRQLPGLRGIAADSFDVDDEQAIALIERVLGSAIQTVVFETDEQVQAAFAYLDGEGAGRARMVSLQRLAAAARGCLTVPPGLRSLRSFVKTSEQSAPLADALLGHVFVAESYEQALAASMQLERSAVVMSSSGVLCHADGTVVAGSSNREDAGILQRKKQIETLSAQIRSLEQEYQKLVHEKETCIINRDEAKFALVEVDEKINRGRQLQQEQETTIRHNENEIHNTLQRMGEFGNEQQLAQQQTAAFEEQLGGCEAELATRQSRLEQLQDNVERAKERVAEMNEERKELAEHLHNVELEMHGLANRINQDRSDIDRLGREVDDASRRKAATIRDQQEAGASMEELKTRIAGLVEALEQQKGRREELEGVNTTIREEYNGILHQIDDERKQVKVVQGDLEAVLNRLHALEIARTRDEQEQRRIRERIWEAYEIDLDSEDEQRPLIEEVDEASVVDNIAMLRERIKRVGQVNMAALEDYETESARLEELTRQRDDLQTAVDDLEKAIRKLDKEAREQFLATFEQVRKNFAEMFTTLFNGGEAHISLAEDVDPLEAPIHINVRPAGKKMRGVQLLSGGERALTAIALLFGLYQVKPSAYCILDELDAPLDDANVGRFIRVLKMFANQTQFIVITHNKRTMEAADILYGVTQQEKGVSQIVSVKFEEAILQAA